MILHSSLSFSQANFTNTKLIVLIEEPNKKIEEKLNPIELTSYHQEIEHYNLNLKKCIDLYWKIGVKPEFVNSAAFSKIVEAKTPNTLLLINSKFNFNYADFSAYKLTNKLYDNRAAIVENYSKKQLPYRATIFELKRADLPFETSAIATAIMPSVKQEEANLIYAVKSLALQIDYRNKGTTEVQLMKMYIKNAPNLKKLTLLLNQSEIDESIIRDLKTHYKLNFLLVSKEEIDQAILTADATKAIALVFPNMDGSFIFKVFDASTMEVLGQSASIPPSEYYPELNNKIKGNHLEDFTHYCD
jgi:hypothetical protein